MAVSHLSHPTKPAPPAYTMRSRKDDINSRAYNPGPGQYNINRSLDKNIAKFGVDDRDNYYRKYATPGPGSYHSPDLKQKAPNYTMRARHETGANTNPGPGDYNTNGYNTRQNNPRWTMRGRPEDRANSIPGVGDYNIGMTRSGSTSFSRAPRFGMNNDSPGPGSYTPANTTFKSKNYFNKAPHLHPSEQKKWLPGPGQYDLKPTLGGNSNRRLPGKLTYSYDKGQGFNDGLDYTASKSPNFSFGNQERLTLDRELVSNPGVGQYNTQPPLPSKKWTMRGRPGDDRSLSPGPGSYNLKKYKEIGSDSPYGKMGRDQRMPDIKDGPGPGDYHVPMESGGPKWQIRQRPHDPQTNTPAFYDVPASVPIAPKYG